MAEIITREVGTTAKNSPLTNSELDTNFININEQLAVLANNSFIPDCINTLGVLIPKGTIVMAVSASNTALRVAPAINNGTFKDEMLLGVLYEDAQPNSTEVKVLLTGLVEGIDTSTWATNTLLYASTSTDGAFVNIQPLPPSSTDSFAVVLDSAVAGSIFVRKQGSKIDKTIGREYSYIMDPTVNDDINSGYRVWDKWLNTSTSTFFMCAGNTAGAANWVAIN